jgi:hypothetical protein
VARRRKADDAAYDQFLLFPLRSVLGFSNKRGGETRKAEAPQLRAKRYDLIGQISRAALSLRIWQACELFSNIGTLSLRKIYI